MSDLSHYEGREQTLIKHQFLTRYLQTAAFKTLQGKSPVFNFVDAFAGPWRVNDESMSDASFDQALRTLESVRSSLVQIGWSGIKIRFCFCEERPEAVSRLREYALQHGSSEIHVFHGLFEDHLDDIRRACSDGFTFTFIDPTGWDVDCGPVFQFLKDLRGEFLLNFMSEHINRHANYSGVTKSFGRFLADPEWEGEFNFLPVEWSNEKRILFLLRKRIKDTEAAQYAPDFPIHKPRENRVKMRLVLGTNSYKGLEVFRDTQEKVERSEIELRSNLKDLDTGQVGLFSNEEAAAFQQDQTGIGCAAFQRQSEERIIDQLKQHDSMTFQDIKVDILEHIPMRLTDVKQLLKDMKKRSLIEYELPPRKRVVLPDTLISRTIKK